MDDFSGTTWEDPIRGDHYEVRADNGLEVVLAQTDGDDSRAVDRRDFPGRFVPE